MKKTVFIIDFMLVKLGRWLRILGEEAEFPRTREDDDAIKQAVAREGILLTRDEELYNKARNYCKAMLMPDSLEEQLALVSKQYSLNLSFKFPDKSFCPKCGGKLLKKNKQQVRRLVWSRVLKEQEEFWQCFKCKQVYWKGSHTKKIIEKLKEVRLAKKTFR